MTARCQFFVKHKNRGCNAPVKAGSAFCGNHISQASGSSDRVPCPFDPSHHILKSEVQEHRKKCPFVRQQREKQEQACFLKDCNKGVEPPARLLATGDSDDLRERQAQPAPYDTDARTSNGIQSKPLRRAAYVRQIGLERLEAIIAKVQRTQKHLEVESLRDVRLPQSEPLLAPDHVNPFSLRHAMQQASIVGNMEACGLLQGAPTTAFVEFGAGKGYLSFMLCQCCQAQNIVLLDNQAFRQKAERTLRKQVIVERRRLDIKDFDPAGMPQLREGCQWVAYGKHLCGAASDYTLRCCVNATRAAENTVRADMGDTAYESSTESAPCTADAAGSASGNGTENALKIADGGVRAEDKGANTDHETVDEKSRRRGTFAGLRGLAVATCCHHRCCWEDYVGTETFEQHGFSPDEFEVVSWMTGWALCGHEAPPGTADKGSGAELLPGTPALKKSSKKRREAVAKIRALEILSQQQGNFCELNEDTLSSTHLNGQANDLEPQDLPEAENQQKVDSMERSDITEAKQWGAPHHRGPLNDNPALRIPRLRRIAIGQMCKRLIDHGRLMYLKAQGFKAESVLYVPSAISGENRLLLATCCSSEHCQHVHMHGKYISETFWGCEDASKYFSAITPHLASYAETVLLNACIYAADQAGIK